MKYKYNIGDVVVYQQHDGGVWVGEIERREHLGIPSYWVSTHMGWVSENKIVDKKSSLNSFEDFYDNEY